MARWAVFDIDGTLLPGASIEARFLANFRKVRHIPYRNLIIYFLKGFMSMMKGNGEDAFKSNKMYLKGIPAQSVREFAQKFCKQHIVPLLSAEGLKNIENYRERHYKILLMSGSLDILVEHIREVCNPDYLICSELEIVPKNSGRFTGRILGFHPYGMRKKQILENLREELEIDFERSVVFANHHSDVHHMELFSEAVAVNPTPELADIARQRGWRIERWG